MSCDVWRFWNHNIHNSTLRVEIEKCVQTLCFTTAKGEKLKIQILLKPEDILLLSIIRGDGSCRAQDFNGWLPLKGGGWC